MVVKVLLGKLPLQSYSILWSMVYVIVHNNNIAAAFADQWSCGPSLVQESWPLFEDW